MKKRNKILGFGLAGLGGYLLASSALYLFQEKYIFKPPTTPKDATYPFKRNFKEINLQTDDNLSINCLHFEVQNPKGVVFYLHGNASNLMEMGQRADLYLDLGYDFFTMDYRGYGKSEGKIKNERQFFKDAQMAYDYLKKTFKDQEIIIIGHSIGTGAASHLAAKNQPRKLVLISPYFNLKEVMKARLPFFPGFLLKYEFKTNEYLKTTKCPITIFHGDDDKVLSYKDSKRLKKYFKEGDEFITLNAHGHEGISDLEQYINKIKEILA